MQNLMEGHKMASENFSYMHIGRI